MMMNKKGRENVCLERASEVDVSANRAGFFLEISRGRTRFPRRPVSAGNFLIGSGPCDLRLGDAQIPALHSILLAEGGSFRLEALVNTPPLVVNGSVVREALLVDGDVIQIGSFRFVARKAVESVAAESLPAGRLLEYALGSWDTGGGLSFERSQSPQTNVEEPTTDVQATTDQATTDAAELTASHLVYLIESEEMLVEQFEEKRIMGAEALIQAAIEQLDDDPSLDEVLESARKFIVDGSAPMQSASRTIGSSQDSDGSSRDREENDEPSDSQLAEDMQKVIEQLDRFSAQLDVRASQMADRESSYVRASIELLDAQEKLAAQLDQVQKQMKSIHPPEAGTLRVIA